MRSLFLRFTMKHYYRVEMVTLQCNYLERIIKYSVPQDCQEKELRSPNVERNYGKCLAFV